MKNLREYLALIALLSLGLGIFWLFDYNRHLQVYVVAGLGMVHFLWGMIHHGFKKQLHWEVVVEYLFISLIGSLALIFLLLRA